MSRINKFSKLYQKTTVINYKRTGKNQSGKSSLMVKAITFTELHLKNNKKQTSVIQDGLDLGHLRKFITFYNAINFCFLHNLLLLGLLILLDEECTSCFRAERVGVFMYKSRSAYIFKSFDNNRPIGCG